MTQKTKGFVWILIGLGAILAVGLLLRNDRAPDAMDPVGKEKDETDTETKPDANTDWDPEKYEQQLHETGLEYQASQNRAERLSQELEAYEMAHRRDTPQREALADEMEALRTKIGEKNQQLADRIAQEPRLRELEQEILEADTRLNELHAVITEKAKAREAARIERASHENDHLDDTPERRQIAAKIERLHEESRARYRKMRAGLEEIPKWKALDRRKQEIENKIETSQADSGEVPEALSEQRRNLVMEAALLERSLESNPEHKTHQEELGRLHDEINAARQELRELYREDETWQALKQAEEAAQQALDSEMDALRAAATARQQKLREKQRLQEELTRELSGAREVLGEIEQLNATLEEKKAALRETFSDDPEWEALNQKQMEAEARREAGLKKVQSLVRSRMRAEATKRSENESENTR